MNTVQRIAKNTAVLMVAQVASFLLSFFSLMYIARYLRLLSLDDMRTWQQALREYMIEKGHIE
jgi:hypothetical protein